MIVNINPTLLPLRALLEFPRGLARGQVITLVVASDAGADLENIPKADAVRVDPVTKVLYIGRKTSRPTLQRHAQQPPRQEPQPQQEQQFPQRVAVEEVQELSPQQLSKPCSHDVSESTTGSNQFTCNERSLESTAGTDLPAQKETTTTTTCPRGNITRGSVVMYDQLLQLQLNSRQPNEEQVEMTISFGQHSATIVQKVGELHRLTFSCWNTVPESFYDGCVQLASRLLSRRTPVSEAPTVIRSQTSTKANCVKTTLLEIDEQSAELLEGESSFKSLYDEFEHFVLETQLEEQVVNEDEQGEQGEHDDEAVKNTESSATTVNEKELNVTDDLEVSADTVQTEPKSRLKRRRKDAAVGEESNSQEDTVDESQEKLFCPICLKINRRVRFINVQALKVHITSNHSVQVIEATECGKCSKRFVSPEAMLNHEKKCNPRFPKKCQVCGKSFSMGLHRDRHMREVHGIIKEHSCGVCGQKYQSEKHRDWHVVKKHRDSLSPQELERLGMEEIQCTLCEFRSYSSKGMQIHRQKEHIENEKPFRCPACGVGNDTLAGIQAHIAARHGVDDRWWICQYCNRTFSRDNREAIDTHVEHHTRDDGAVCVHCNKMFENEPFMLDHVNRNHDKNALLYICDICDQGTESYKELLKHMLKHNPFKTSLYRLQRQHIEKRNIEEGILHRRERRMQTQSMFECEMCGKQFDLEATLMSHRIIFHNDPGKEFYRCSICSKAFKPHHLSYHLRLHTDERPHKCRYCDASFHTVASCTDHEIVKHTFAYKLFCPRCNKGFVSRAKTWQHLLRFHKETREKADELLPPIPHKMVNILQKRRETEEIKHLIQNATVASQELQDPPAGILSTTTTAASTSGNDATRLRSGVFRTRQGNIDEEEVEEMAEVELTDETLHVGDANVVEIKGSIDDGVEIAGMPTEVCLASELEPGVYPQPDLGPDVYRVVLGDGSQTTLRLEPGQQVLLEDENGHQQIIQLQTADEQRSEIVA